MNNKNEPAGEVYVSANRDLKQGLVVQLERGMADHLKSANLQNENIILVLPGEAVPDGAQLITDFTEGKIGAVKDISGMTGEAGRYYRMPKEPS